MNTNAKKEIEAMLRKITYFRFSKLTDEVYRDGVYLGQIKKEGEGFAVWCTEAITHSDSMCEDGVFATKAEAKAYIEGAW